MLRVDPREDRERFFVLAAFILPVNGGISALCLRGLLATGHVTNQRLGRLLVTVE